MAGRRKLTPAEWEHGNDATYTNHRCRCERCREAHRVARRRYKTRKAQQQWKASGASAA